MKRISLLTVALLALILAASATATIPVGAPLPLSPTASQTTEGCTNGLSGYSYSGDSTLVGMDGYSNGSPASPISRGLQISPMSGGLLHTSNHAVAWLGVTESISGGKGFGDWAQAGIAIGAVPANGWNPTTNQYFGGWHMYVEYNNATSGQYYFQDYGTASATDTFVITQGTDGLFYIYINGTPALTQALVRVGLGRWVSGTGEDYTSPLSPIACDNYDFFFQPTITAANYNRRFADNPLDFCWRQGNGNYDVQWEAWNKNYSANPRHGLPGPGIGPICAF